MNHLPKCPICKRAAGMTVNRTFCNHWAGAHVGEYCEGSRQPVPQEYFDEQEKEKQRDQIREEEDKQRLARVDKMRKEREKERKKKRLELVKARHSKEWKAERAKLIGEYCEQCGSNESLCLHHWDESSYKDIQNYKTFADKKVVTLCKRCHFALHKGMNLCPNCKKYYKQIRFTVCYTCSKQDAPNNHLQLKENGAKVEA